MEVPPDVIYEIALHMSPRDFMHFYAKSPVKVQYILLDIYRLYRSLRLSYESKDFLDIFRREDPVTQRLLPTIVTNYLHEVFTKYDLYDYYLEYFFVLRKEFEDLGLEGYLRSFEVAYDDLISNMMLGQFRSTFLYYNDRWWMRINSQLSDDDLHYIYNSLYYIAIWPDLEYDINPVQYNRIKIAEMVEGEMPTFSPLGSGVPLA